jgi:hypothetical protein
MPVWLLSAIGVIMTLTLSTALGWAVQIDRTQRSLIQDVSRLDEVRVYTYRQLERIEVKVDKLLEKR